MYGEPDTNFLSYVRCTFFEGFFKKLYELLSKTFECKDLFNILCCITFHNPIVLCIPTILEICLKMVGMECVSICF